jgi:sugar (pentulose or hexulose) kinase
VWFLASGTACAARCVMCTAFRMRTKSGKTIERVCIVGGGVKNEALNRLAALSTDLEVVKGSSESTLTGNVAVQIGALENTRSLEEIQSIASRLAFEGEAWQDAEPSHPCQPRPMPPSAPRILRYPKPGPRERRRLEE